MEVFSFLMSNDPSVPGELRFGQVPMERYSEGLRSAKSGGHGSQSMMDDVYSHLEYTSRI